MNVVVQCVLRLAPPTRPSEERPPVMYGHVSLVPRVSARDRYYCTVTRSIVDHHHCSPCLAHCLNLSRVCRCLRSGRHRPYCNIVITFFIVLSQYQGFTIFFVVSTLSFPHVYRVVFAAILTIVLIIVAILPIIIVLATRLFELLIMNSSSSLTIVALVFLIFTNLIFILNRRPCGPRYKH